VFGVLGEVLDREGRSRMKVVKQITGKNIKFGGEEHEDWLPPNASLPKATAIENPTIDVQIVEEADGYLLAWQSQSGSKAGDTWHETIEDAERQAENQFGAEEWEWQNDEETT
jgi:hypothetical protein